MAPILRAGRNVWRTAGADATGVLVDARDYYRAFYWAARSAERYILMSGWQFDSGVPVLRGDDVPAGAEVRFLRFLDGLCRARPALAVYILAWDFHAVFALEREWAQRVYFHWLTSPRFHFRFDEARAPGGSHHQKFVVVDGRLAFLGGMDVCDARWDDRCHRADNPARLSHGHPQKPYHDVQAYLAGGDAPLALVELFEDRWARAGGPALSLRPARGPAVEPPAIEGALALGPARVALSRTDPRGAAETVREVERLFLDAIAAAERLIYVETQYFSSARICAALVQRLHAPGPPLDVVVVVNERAEALKEELAVGLRQAENLDRLRAAAAGTPHALGLYFSRCEHPDDRFGATYIHSKVLLVDDRFLSVGSANLTNRSMGVDSELHVSWEVARDDAAGRALARAIRRVRVSLLAEHAGVRGAAVRRLVAPGGLVARLDGLAARAGARLACHGPPTPTQQAVLDLIDPEDLPFDPAGPDADPDAAGRAEPADERRARPARPWQRLVRGWRTRVARGHRPPAPVTPAHPVA